ncbi:hypothetical protein SAMN05444157_3515 [Frankineae bacterium MT45]|nr:hypothetical protein SAMN05444157_3515 [Frankineae bacterium MT45]
MDRVVPMRSDQPQVARRRVRYLLRALSTLGLICSVLAAAAPAQATPGPTPSPDPRTQRASFGVQPATPTHPDSRSILSYNVTPGVGLDDYVAIENIGLTPLTLAVYAADATTSRDGKVVFDAAGQRPVAVGSWITVGGSGHVTVPASSHGVPGVVIVPVRLKVPANASPGDHVGAVVASLVSAAVNKSGGEFQLDQRVAQRMYVRVSGALLPRLSVENVHVTYHPGSGALADGSASVRYTVKNTGNAILDAKQEITLTGWFGSSVSAHNVPQIQALLPGGSVEQRLEVAGVAPRVRLTATVRLTPTAAITSQADPSLKPYVGSATTWAVPWLLLVIVAAVLLLLALALWWRWWRNRPTGRHSGELKPSPNPEPERESSDGPGGSRAPQPVGSGA